MEDNEIGVPFWGMGQRVEFTRKDGTVVSGTARSPASYQTGKVPVIMDGDFRIERIHANDLRAHEGPFPKDAPASVQKLWELWPGNTRK